MITLRKIEREVQRYRSNDRIMSMKLRQDEYKKLVEQYDIDIVAAASGLTKATLRQYLCATSPNIGYEQLLQAKTVLNKFS